MAKYTLPPGEKGQFSNLPEGVYHMQIQSPKEAYAKGSGAPTIECYLGVLDGPYAGERLYHQYSLEAQSMWRLRDDLRTLGKLSRVVHPTDQPAELEGSEMVSMLNGAVGYAAIFIDPYKGSPRSKLSSDGFLTPEELTARGIQVSVPVQQAVAPQAVTPPPGIPEAQEPF